MPNAKDVVVMHRTGSGVGVEIGDHQELGLAVGMRPDV